MLLLLGLVALMLKNAWLSDDAFITFRTVDNVVSGHGPVYNVGERVQGYTHPLWMGLLVPLRMLLGELCYSTFALSILLSAVAAGILLMRAGNRQMVIFTALALASSKAFMDYTTSGLENPLSYFLLALLVAQARKTTPTRKSLFTLSLLASFAALNRLDMVLITSPLLAYQWWKLRGTKSLTAVLLGQSPLIAWTIFSLLYYGAPVANTVYAKLGAGVPLEVTLLQGTAYFTDSWLRDPVTLTSVSVAMVLGTVGGRAHHVCLGIGISLYLLYILTIGGDFMSGRFFAVPMFVSAGIMAGIIERWRPIPAGLACSALLLLSLPSVKANLLSGPRFGDVPLVQTEQFGPLPLSLIPPNGISDERAFYYPATGLLRPDGDPFPSHQWARWGRQARSSKPGVVVGYAIGMWGYYAGPEIHVIDRNALTDFLLARLPVPPGEIPRIGHFTRELPPGYLESVETGENRLAAPAMAEFYDAVRLVIESPLLSEERLTAIWKMNTGGYAQLIESASP